MSDSTVHGADDVEALSPNERSERVRDGVIIDANEMPAELVDRARERLAARVAQRDAATPTR